MHGEYKEYVDIKDALINLLEAGYTIPMIETVLEQIEVDSKEKVFSNSDSIPKHNAINRMCTDGVKTVNTLY